MAQRVLLIINPKSGTRSKDAVADELAGALAAHGAYLEVAVTTGAGDAGRFARQAVEDEYDKVIVAGGDGTVSEAATSLCGSDLPLAIIPGGSGNGLARSLCIPSDFHKAVEVAVEGKKILIDRGVVNDKPFFCTFGMGFDAAVSQKFAEEKRRGKMSYLKNAFQEFLSFSPDVYALSVDGQIITERALVVAVCNASQYGNNAYIAPQASLSDGLLDITLIHDGPIVYQALAGIQLMSGRIDKNILVDTFQVKQAEIVRLNEGPAHLDGEPMMMGRHMHVKCEPAQLHVIASPEAEKPFRPLTDPIRSFVQDVTTDVLTDIHSLLRPIKKNLD